MPSSLPVHHQPSLIALPGGEFLRGSADDDEWGFADERPRHRVALSAFRMAAVPVTRNWYRQVTGNWFSDWGNSDGQLPATHLSWSEAVAFCNRLSRQEGLTACYRRRFPWRLVRVPGAGGYRLPSEAEWEYAARAGSEGRYWHGDDPAALGQYAWYADNAGQRLQAVAGRAANPWGLYDLVGNVWEWCEDWWQPYPPGPLTDPVERRRSEARVVRGGAYGSAARDLRPAARNGYPPATTSRRVGFRVVRGGA